MEFLASVRASTVFAAGTLDARAHDALRVSEMRYRRLFETALDGILLLNADTAQIEDVNPFLIRMLGYSHAEFLGKKLWEVGPFEDIAQSKEMFAELQQRGHVRYEYLPLKTKEGVAIEVEFVSNAYDCAGIQVIQCNIRDITERKAAEEKLHRLNAELEERVTSRTLALENANRELDAFSYSVAHDLRAPLRAINGFSSLVVEANRNKLDADSASYLARIQASALNMTQMIDDLLDLAHVSRREMHMADFDLSALASHAAAALAQAHPGRDIHLTVQTELRAHGDARLVRIALDNLLANAWKFTGHVGAACIEVGQTRQTGETVYFVRDNGAGFDMLYASKLFGPFQRLHGQQEFEGTGIGLSIVQRICLRHGGRVWGEGKVGQGATFYFTLGTPPGKPPPP